MSNFNKSSKDPFGITEIKADKISHISIKEPGLCGEGCQNKPCTYYCPTRVFSWKNDMINVDYSRCVECGACPYGCPSQNINWEYPRNGFGVVYKY